MKTLGIIPARFGSTRFPGKPLALIHGKSMIQRVFERASKASLLAEVVVATDDDRIYNHVVEFGGKAVMTSPDHPSGTDRCAEVLKLNGKPFDFVVNIQGDEPYIHPQQIDLLINCLANSNASIGTLVKKIVDPKELLNRNIPKVVFNSEGIALYFSRQAIPYCKEENLTDFLKRGFFYKHIGIYGYRASILPKLEALPTGKLEQS